MPAMATGSLCAFSLESACFSQDTLGDEPSWGRFSNLNPLYPPGSSPLSSPWVCFKLAKEPFQRGIGPSPWPICTSCPGHPCWRLLGGTLGLEPSPMALRLDSPRPNTSWDKCQSEHSLSPVLHQGPLRSPTHYPHFSVGKIEPRRGWDLPKTTGSFGLRWAWHLVLPLSSSGTNESCPPREWAGWGLRAASSRERLQVVRVLLPLMLMGLPRGEGQAGG